MPPDGTMETRNEVGPVIGQPHRLARLERAIRAQEIVNGGDVEVFPAETGVGRILRLSTWLRSRMGLGPGGEPNAAEEAPTATVGPVLLKIHGLHPDSPVSGVRMYHGDLYANGSVAALTTADVTVRIPGIAANVTLPSWGTWADTGTCGALPITETWVGATQTHTADTVYETIGELLLR